METQIHQPRNNERPATPVSPADRTHWEIAEIEKAKSEIAAGLGIDDQTLETWLDALDQDPNLALPVIINTP